MSQAHRTLVMTVIPILKPRKIDYEQLQAVFKHKQMPLRSPPSDRLSHSKRHISPKRLELILGPKPVERLQTLEAELSQRTLSPPEVQRTILLSVRND